MKYKLLNIKFKISKNINKLKYPVVLLRGLGRSMSFWLNFEEELSKYCDIIFIDLLGTGGSKDLFGRGSIAKFAQDVLYTLKKNNIKNFHLAGISLGGMVSIEISRQLIQKDWSEFHLKSIAIMSSSSAGFGLKRINYIPLFLIMIAIITSVIKGKPSHKLFSKYLISGEDELGNIKIVDTWDNIWKDEYFSKLALIRQLLAAAFYKVKINKNQLKYNYLFVVSKDDKLVPWINTVYLWQKIPFSELSVLDKLGHDITTDNPSLISDLLFNYFKKFEFQ